MPDDLDPVQERIDADNARIVENRRRFEGESATECVECGEAIPEERRKALPGIETCVYCAELDERS